MRIMLASCVRPAVGGDTLGIVLAIDKVKRTALVSKGSLADLEKARAAGTWYPLAALAVA